MSAGSSSPLEFKFKWLDDAGNESGFFSKTGSYDGMLLKLDLAELAMASIVCVGGPASAPALASAMGWRDLLIPGILAGSLGYAIGSFIGITLVEFLR